MNSSFLLQLFKDTLLIIPCSGAKQSGSKPSNALSILSALDPACGAKLADARAALRDKARVDDSTLMPAYLRYSGQLYNHASTSIGRAVPSSNWLGRFSPKPKIAQSGLWLEQHLQAPELAEDSLLSMLLR